MTRQNKYRISFLVNNLLLLSGISMVISGMVLQIGFHIGSAPGNLDKRMDSHTVTIEPVREINPGKTIWGVDYKEWTLIHKTAIVFFSLLMLYHLTIHRKWYTGVIAKHLIRKNKPVIILTVLFILVAFTGITSWLVDLSGNKGTIRIDLMEIHDKLAIVLIIYLVSHVVRRVRWFSKTYEKVNTSQTVSPHASPHF